MIRTSKIGFLHACFLFTALFVPTLAFADEPAAAKPKQLRAGAATSNVTPWLGLSINGYMNDRKAAHIHDELHARCIALDNGETRIAIAIVDSCMIPREIDDDAKKQIQEATGWPADHILIAATHTHSGTCATGVFQSDPDRHYQTFLAIRIADGIRRAINNLAPAKIGWGVGSLPEEVFNRRWKMKPGTIEKDPFGGTTDQIKMNPPQGSPNLVEPAGPTDPEIPFIAIQSADGKPIALLANFALHYVGGEGAGHISADYFAMFADRIQELLKADRLDPPFVGILSNGACADINNINFREQPTPAPPYSRMHRLANKVADEVLRNYQKLEWRDWIPLAIAQQEIELGVRLPKPEEVQRAQEIVNKAAAEKREMRGYEEIYARETVLLSKYPSKVPIILQALRIGDVGIAAIPCEVFVEIGLDLKKRSPLKPTFTIELANGYNGYLPTAAQHKLGGYETWRARSSYLEVEAAEKIMNVMLDLFSHLTQTKR